MHLKKIRQLKITILGLTGRNERTNEVRQLATAAVPILGSRSEFPFVIFHYPAGDET